MCLLHMLHGCPEKNSFANTRSWIVPKNVAVNQVFGMVSDIHRKTRTIPQLHTNLLQVTGLGLFPLTFDWSMVSYNTNPLLSPHWAALNVFLGFAIFFWIVTPVCGCICWFS